MTQNISKPNAWYNKTWLVITLCILFFPLGLYALWKNTNLKKEVRISIGLATLVFIVLISRNSDKHSSEGNSSSSDNSTTQATVSHPQIGQTLHTKYFDITVNSAGIQNEVNTGNPYADLKPSAGNKYLVMNVTFKNIDNEGRMLTNGNLLINYNGKDYDYDVTENVMLEGWGIVLDNINPLVSKTTNLVYKIPNELTGVAYWRPGRAEKDEMIELGSIK